MGQWFPEGAPYDDSLNGERRRTLQRYDMTISQWRTAREAAYKRGDYVMRAPDVCSVHWSTRDWCNFVRFNDTRLNGFDDGSDDGNEIR